MESNTLFNGLIIAILSFIFLLVCIVVSWLLYLVVTSYRDKLKWKSKYLNNKYLLLYLVTASVCISIYEAYTAVYPGDDFYFDEFKYVAGKDIPQSAIIKFKDSSYPDFHGDYFSKSIIELSGADYNKLLNELQTDKDLTENKDVAENELKIFRREIPGKEDQTLFITFLKDGKTIIVDIIMS